MKVSDAVERRSSIRAYSDKPVSNELLTEVFEKAGRAPSGGNLQPWHVVIVNGEKLDEFKAIMRRRLDGEAHPDKEVPEYQVYPPKLKEPYRTARFEVGEDMYGLLGIEREERDKRLQWFANNY